MKICVQRGLVFGTFLVVLFAFAVIPAFGAEEPSLDVIVYSADGNRRMPDIEVQMKDNYDLVEAPEENSATTNRDGIAHFGRKAFDGFTLQTPDGKRDVFDALDRGRSYSGEFKVKVRPLGPNSVPQSHELNVQVNGTMESELNLGESA